MIMIDDDAQAEPFFICLREVSPIWTRRPDILKIDNL